MMNMTELKDALGAMDPTELALGAGLVGVIATLVVIGGIVWFFLSAVGYFKMFKKAGQRGWFAFVPVLRDYALFKMAWTLKAFVVCIVLLGAFQITSEMEGTLVGLVAAVCGIAWLVVHIKLLNRVAKSFGKGTVWVLLLLFVPFIATLILGFGSAEYLGNPETVKVE